MSGCGRFDYDTISDQQHSQKRSAIRISSPVVTRQLGEEKNQSLPQDEESVSQSLVAPMEEPQNERDTLTAQNSQAQEELASMEAQITSIQEQLAAAAPSEPENPPAAEPVQEPTAPSSTGNGKTIYLTFDDGPSYLLNRTDPGHSGPIWD